MRNKILLSCIFFLLFSCDDTANKRKTNDLNYFDIKGYFSKEVIRLTGKNPLINKTVEVNESTELKKIKISDWKKELSIFYDADINRASWKGLFHLKKSKDQELYISDNEKVPVKELLVIYKNDEVYGLKILVKNTNSLYTSVDTLTYYPDSLYQIKKMQDIRLLSKKNYTIIGKF